MISGNNALADWYPKDLLIEDDPVIEERNCIEGDYMWQQITLMNWAENIVNEKKMHIH